MAILTTVAIKNAKPEEKPYLIYDSKERGLHVHISVVGTKTFRFKTKLDGKAKIIKLGDFKHMTLEQARQRAFDLNVQIQNGIDPTVQIVPEFKTFAEVSKEFVAWKRDEFGRAEGTIRKYQECLDNDLLPAFANTSIKEIHTKESVAVIEKINARSNSLAIKNIEMLNMVVMFAIQRGYRDSYTQLNLSGLIKEKPVKPKIMPSSLKDTFDKIDQYPTFIMRCAITIQFHVFLRGSEIMGGRWEEIDFEKKQWVVPADRMKMKRTHIVPLTSQTIELLTKLKSATGDSAFLFPSSKSVEHIGRDALSKAFRAADLKIVPHGCRTLAGTWMRNNKYLPHLVETQLSHCESNQIAAAYQTEPHMLYLDERRGMMQEWSNHLSESAK
ncbi:tyrosine-type recombinase/integrase [Gallionella capsiferriformans]|uniref:Integrase family protein n=1 Tax=Gallionella capsiferriformans (strain ES-2) TaxID=395494 RepID=D9SII6_GALCS|nr:integrase arm-type DNA-binding domain-containing protein [Gallionella capsiferriformans]ADL56149.1 integrase family protein [Gallionella capsiferriformans ES-2]